MTFESQTTCSLVTHISFFTSVITDISLLTICRNLTVPVAPLYYRAKHYPKYAWPWCLRSKDIMMSRIKTDFWLKVKITYNHSVLLLKQWLYVALMSILIQFLRHLTT